jgi:putative ABC transport system permease protein
VLLGEVEASTGVNRFPGAEDGVAILGEDAAGYYQTSTGQDVIINGQALRVIGVLNRSSMESVNISAILPLATAQRVFGKEEIVSAVLLTTGDVSKVEQVAAALRRDYPRLEVTTQEEMLLEAERVLKMPMLYMRTMSITAFVIAMAVILSTMVMAVMERTREIGTLRAIGTSRWLVFKLILMEILILALTGGMIGTLLTIPMALKMGATPPTILQHTLTIIFAIIAGCAGGFYPAWRAARVNPADALRYE